MKLSLGVDAYSQGSFTGFQFWLRRKHFTTGVCSLELFQFPRAQSFIFLVLFVCDEAPQSARGDECARLFYETHDFFLLMIKLEWPKFSEKVSFFITFFSEHEFWCHHIRMHVHWEKVVQPTRFLLMFAIFCCSWQHFLVTDSILSLF